MLLMLWVGLASIFAAFAIWAYFAYLWLRTGFWPDATAIDGLCWLMECAPYSWAYRPEDWVGIHKALMWLSPAGALLLIGAATLWAFASLANRE